MTSAAARSDAARTTTRDSGAYNGEGRQRAAVQRRLLFYRADPYPRRASICDKTA